MPKSVADKLREIQGQLPPVKITVFTTGEEKIYTFTKLKRKECHETLYNLVKPFITIVSTIIENAKDADGKPIDLENIDPEKTGKLKGLDIALIGQIFEAIPFDRFWLLAKKLLKGVIVDGIPINDFDNDDENVEGYYDDKQIELLQAVYTAAMVNYPFLSKLMIMGKKSKDSAQSGEKNIE